MFQSSWGEFLSSTKFGFSSIWSGIPSPSVLSIMMSSSSPESGLVVIILILTTLGIWFWCCWGGSCVCPTKIHLSPNSVYVPVGDRGSSNGRVSGCHRWPRQWPQISTHLSFSKLHSASNSDSSHPTLPVVLHHPSHFSHCHQPIWSSSLSLSPSEISSRKFLFGREIFRGFG